MCPPKVIARLQPQGDPEPLACGNTKIKAGLPSIYLFQALLADSKSLNYSQTVTLLILQINSSHFADKETETEREGQPAVYTCTRTSNRPLLGCWSD